MSEEKNKIVYEDDDILIINKDLGFAVQSADKEAATIETYLKEHYEEYFIITRIDQVVSGLVLIAKNKPMANRLTRKLKANKIKKSYVVLVEGHPEPEQQIINKSLIKKGSKAYVSKQGKKAMLMYETIKRLDRYTFLNIGIEHGRFHQIRCLLGHIGYPIKGDVKYGARRSNREGKGIYLHCDRMEIPDYSDNFGDLTIEAGFPSMKLWELK
jgi:23S rRNA pseudouridine1911/1915/1917 synthase